MHRILPGRPARWRRYSSKSFFNASRQVFFPGGFKNCPRLFEGHCRVFNMEAMVGRQVKAALPAPLIDIDRDTSAGRNRSDVHVAVIDVPAVGAIG
jgi:hypothetical protein